jgi:hypothetical protein
MKIYIDREHCELCQSYCDRHVAKLVRFPEGEDRPCIQAVEDDGSAQLTLVVQDKSQSQPITLILDDKDREIIGLEGLSGYLPS